MSQPDAAGLPPDLRPVMSPTNDTITDDSSMPSEGSYPQTGRQLLNFRSPFQKRVSPSQHPEWASDTTSIIDTSSLNDERFLNTVDDVIGPETDGGENRTMSVRELANKQFSRSDSTPMQIDTNLDISPDVGMYQ
ncbi:hypothetical protein H072_7199 [Dactylellina haptotyla CBS 200.50]|uniref:Uncharacterized protein n=1 Tax=Dactylellina haptotyla (strain CBS 200.50) TaxID=1284197 RepID=S8AD39_DACHA|nr:hypothetical protein H072_7199 [Dactylellina haptotyla CBS 200.50]